MIMRIMRVINMMIEEQNLFMVTDFTNLGTKNPAAVHTEILTTQTETGISLRATEINMMIPEINTITITEKSGDLNILTPPRATMIHSLHDANLLKVEHI